MDQASIQFDQILNSKWISLNIGVSFSIFDNSLLTISSKLSWKAAVYVKDYPYLKSHSLVV